MILPVFPQAEPAVPATPTFLLGKALIRAFSPGGTQGLSILIFHRVLPQKDPLFPEEIDRADFDQILRILKSMFTVIPLSDAVRRAKAGTLPPNAACITFDDGYADNAEVAMPVLREHAVSATFFVATGFLDGGRMWNDTVIEVVRRFTGPVLDADAIGLGRYPLKTIEERRHAIMGLIGALKYLPLEERGKQISHLVELANVVLPDDLMMTSEQVRQLSQAGMDIGGHTVNHPILAKLPSAQARAEIEQGKLALEAIIGAPITLFAYPNGKPGTDYAAEHVAMIRELGFEAAVSTSRGASKHSADLFQLPRFSPWDRTPLRFALRMVRNLSVSPDLA